MFGEMKLSDRRCSVCGHLLLVGVPQNSRDGREVHVHSQHAADHAPVLAVSQDTENLVQLITDAIATWVGGDPQRLRFAEEWVGRTPTLEGRRS